MKLITQEYLKSILDYTPKTGGFTWIKSRGAVKVGRKAGHLRKDGYTAIIIHKQYFLAHRLAFLFMNGYLPEGQVDHINQGRSDNAWINLREVTHSQNQANCAPYKNNKSGYKGITFLKGRGNGKWKARITINGRLRYLGTFDCKEEAISAYNAAAIDTYGKFAFLNETKIKD